MQTAIIEKYKNGATLNSLGEQYGISGFLVKKILLKNGIQVRRKGQIRPISKHSVNDNYFEKIDTPEKAYWLGFLAADGSVSKDGCKLTLLLKNTDRKSIENFREAISSTHKISDASMFDKRTQKTYHRSSIQVSSRNFVDKLVSMGITNNKSFTCGMPMIPEHLFSHFLRGLFDGDGSICFISRGTRKINLIMSENLYNGVSKVLCETLKIALPKPSLVAESAAGQKILKLHINAIHDQDKFLEFIYNESSPEIRLERKYNLSLIKVAKRKTGPKPK